MTLILVEGHLEMSYHTISVGTCTYVNCVLTKGIKACIYLAYYYVCVIIVNGNIEREKSLLTWKLSFLIFSHQYAFICKTLPAPLFMNRECYIEPEIIKKLAFYLNVEFFLYLHSTCIYVRTFFSNF